MFGLVSRMSRLDCVRESMRLALQELEGSVNPAERPAFWQELWERYICLGLACGESAVHPGSFGQRDAVHLQCRWPDHLNDRLKGQPDRVFL